MSGRTSLPELPPGRRSALVVTVSAYADAGLARLRAPARDAAALAEVLGAPEIGGFDVRGLTDPTAQEIRSGVDDFLAGRGTDELVLVYFSCHGLLDARGRLYFAGSDTRKGRLASSGVEAGWLLEQLEECRARRQVVILDCCFSGAFAQGAKTGERDVDLKSRIVGHGRGRAVLTASRSREYSFEGESLTGTSAPTGSVFTTGFVDGLRTGAADTDGDGFISVEDAFDHAAAYVTERGTEQTPQRWVYGAEGRIWLARAALCATADDDLPEALRMALDSPLPAVRIGGVTALGEWLSDGDKARYRLARRHLEHIAATDNPAVARAARALLAPPEAARPTAAAPSSRRTAPPREVKAPPRRAAHRPVPQPPPRRAAHRPVPQPPPRGTAPSRVTPPPARAVSVPGLLHPLPVWEASNASAQDRWVTSMDVHPTAPLVAIAVHGGSPQVWNYLEGRLAHTLNGNDYDVAALGFRPDGSFLAASDYDSGIRLWDLQRGSELRTLKTDMGSSPGQLAITSDGRQLAVTQPVSVVVWNAATGQQTHSFGPFSDAVPDSFITALAFSPDGRVLAIGTHAGAVRILNMSSGRCAARSKHHQGLVAGLAFSPDGRRMASLGSEDGSVVLWDAGKWRRRPRQLQVDVGVGPLGHIAFSPDGRFLGISTGIGVHLLDPDGDEQVVPLDGLPGDATSTFAFSHSGELLASAGISGGVGIWNPSNARQLYRLKPHRGYAATPGFIGFAPDDRHLVTAAHDGVYVWQLR